MSEMRELTVNELDAVCGGFSFSPSDSFNHIRVTQQAAQYGAAVGGYTLWGNANATNTQTITQSSSISL